MGGVSKNALYEKVDNEIQNPEQHFTIQTTLEKS